MPTYEAPGKQDFRELLLALARLSDVRTYGTFWGSGIDSRMFSVAGLQVTAAEIVRAKHDALSYDALMHGYRAHLGRAGRLAEPVGMFHADFDGGPSPRNFREVRRIAAITDQWLAVTLSMDHLRDESMMSEAAFYTVPAWLTGASGFTLEYLGRYKRNRFGQVMWVAVLRPGTGKGEWHPVQTIQVAYSLGDRGYWASRRMYETGLMRHAYGPRNEREKAGDRARYEARAKVRNRSECVVCGSEFWRTGGPQRYCSDACRLPMQKARRVAYHHDWYEARKALAVQSTASEALQKAA